MCVVYGGGGGERLLCHPNLSITDWGASFVLIMEFIVVLVAMIVNRCRSDVPRPFPPKNPLNSPLLAHFLLLVAIHNLN